MRKSVVVLHRRGVIQCRLHPPARAELQLRPGVGDDLIPAVGEEEASIVLRTQALAFKSDH